VKGVGLVRLKPHKAEVVLAEARILKSLADSFY